MTVTNVVSYFEGPIERLIIITNQGRMEISSRDSLSLPEFKIVGRINLPEQKDIEIVPPS